MFLLLICTTVIPRYSRGLYLLNNKTKIDNEMLFANFILSQQDSLYVSLCNPRYPPFEVPYSRHNEYILNWFAGSYWNKEKMERYSGMSDIGIYTLTKKTLYSIPKITFI